MIRLVEALIIISLTVVGTFGFKSVFGWLTSRVSASKRAYSECATALSSRDPTQICSTATRHAGVLNSKTLSHMYAEAARLADNEDRELLHNRFLESEKALTERFEFKKKEILK